MRCSFLNEFINEERMMIRIVRWGLGIGYAVFEDRSYILLYVKAFAET